VYYPDFVTHPWSEGYCVNTGPIPSGRPAYPSMLDCCKGVYGGQVSGACLSKLDSPLAMSSTPTVGVADFYYADYSVSWNVATCKNDLPLPFAPGGRVTYSSMLECCNSAYGTQTSGKCLGALESPPTMSPTTSGELDVYYPDITTPWSDAYCINTRPMPSGRPAFPSLLDCCEGEYSGQVSGACLSKLDSDSPPTTSPTPDVGVTELYYPDLLVQPQFPEFPQPQFPEFP